MEEAYFADKDITQDDLRDGVLPKGEYDNCSFHQLDMPEVDLSGYVFMDCRFESCNLGNAKIQGSSMKSVSFKGCKLTGLQFGDCHPFLFAVSFDDCRLEYASFHARSMKGTTFRKCMLIEVDFTEADLSGAVFDDCKMGGSQFGGANLEKADLRSSEGFTIDPNKTKMKKAKLRLQSLPGLLGGYDLIIEP